MADALEGILQNTLLAIQSGKEEIFFIAESTRSETERLAEELVQLRAEIIENIEQVDRKQHLEKRLRQKLMEVNRDFTRYSEQYMMKTYSAAKDAQVELQLLQAKEGHLRRRRDEIERSLKQMQGTVERAENLMTQVNMAFNLLTGGITELTQGQNAELKHEIGLRIIKAQEDERQRVARDIHDGPAQTLANIVLRLEIAEKLLEIDQRRVKQELNDLKNLVRSNLQDIRRIIFDLRPMALDDLGLVPALAKYFDNFQASHGIKVNFKVNGREKRLLPSLEIAVFRLIQEGMTNVAKHSLTDRVEVSVQFQDDSIRAMVKDFGQGFNAQKTLETAHAHFGLVGMRERIEMFSGQFFLVSENSIGTTVEFEIPITDERGANR